MFLEIKKRVPSEDDYRIMPQDLIAEGSSVNEAGEMFKVQMFHAGHNLLIRMNDDSDREYTVSLSSILRVVLIQEELEKMTQPQRVKFFNDLDKKLEVLKNENKGKDRNTG